MTVRILTYGQVAPGRDTLGAAHLLGFSLVQDTAVVMEYGSC